jgi:tetratricopeptide (TPR) repeat protein
MPPTESPQHETSSDWLKFLSDPYAVLAVSVAADDKRVLKRYRTVAKQLHPDRYAGADAEISTLSEHLIAKLVNPAYARINQEKGRAESVALLRLQARRMLKEANRVPRCEVARQLMQQPLGGMDVFYEQAVSDLADQQFSPLASFAAVTAQLMELNSMYFQMKLGDVFIGERRSGLINTTEVKPPAPGTFRFNEPGIASHDYAQRHFARAQQYVEKYAFTEAVTELKGAIKLEADRADYHALMSYAYLRQELPGMATVYAKQALKLDPNNSLAKQVGAKLKLPQGPANLAGATPAQSAGQTTGQTTGKPADKRSGLFGLFRR